MHMVFKKVYNFKNGIGIETKKVCKQVKDQRNDVQVLLDKSTSMLVHACIYLWRLLKKCIV